MGFNVVIEETLEGARGKHEIDVVARTSLGGVATLWIVECKYWKTSVPKAQVLTLAQIAQDVGANHAFLLSERGFQAGAIAAVSRTNVSLTNIQELKAVAADSIAELSIRQSLTDVKALEKELQDLLLGQRLRTPPPPRLDETVTLLGACLEVTMAATAALTARYPVRLPTMLSPTASESAYEPAAVAAALGDTVHEIARRSGTLKAAVSAAVIEAAKDAEELIRRAQELVAISEALLQDTSHTEMEEAKLRDAVRAMKAVGDQAEKLRDVPAEKLRASTGALMRNLVDGLYLWLADPARTPETWEQARDGAEAAISGLSAAAGEARVAKT